MKNRVNSELLLRNVSGSRFTSRIFASNERRSRKSLSGLMIVIIHLLRMKLKKGLFGIKNQMKLAGKCI